MNLLLIRINMLYSLINQCCIALVFSSRASIILYQDLHILFVNVFTRTFHYNVSR